MCGVIDDVKMCNKEMRNSMGQCVGELDGKCAKENDQTMVTLC